MIVYQSYTFYKNDYTVLNNQLMIFQRNSTSRLLQARTSQQAESKGSKQKDIQEISDIQTQNSSNLDRVQYLQNTIQLLQASNQRLQMQLKDTRHKVKISQFSQKLSSKFDDVLALRNKETLRQIQRLTEQNSQLKIQIHKNNEIKIERKQIVLPSLLADSKGSIEKKLGSQTENLRLKYQIQLQKTQNQHLTNSLSKVSQNYKTFEKKYKKEYEDLNLKYQASQAKNSDLDQQTFKIKYNQHITHQNFSKKEAQIEKIKNKNKLFFSYLKDILKNVSINDAQNKLSTHLNTLTAQQFQEEKKRATIIDIIKQNKNKYKDLQERYKKSEGQKANLQRALQKKENALNQTQKQLNSTKSQKSILEQNLRDEITIKQQLIRQKGSLLQLKSKNQQKIQLLEKNIQNKTTTIASLQAEKKKNLQLMQQKTLKIKQLQTIRLANEQTIQELSRNIGLLTTKVQNLEKDVERLKKDKNEMQLTISSQIADLQKKKKRISVLEEIEQKLRQEVATLKDDIKDLQNEDKISKSQIARLQNLQKLQKQKITKLEQDIDSLNRSLNQEKYTSAQRMTMLEKVNRELISQASYYYLGASQTFKSIPSQNTKGLSTQISGLLSSWKDSYDRAKFFNGSEIINKDNIRFLLKSLDEFMGCTPFESKLVYKYDPLNPVNFHNYFDRVENLIVLVKISNGTIIGGFSVYPVDQERIYRPGKGFLFSVTGKKVYQMRAQPRHPVVGYDNYFFLFGNAEIRLKSQEKKVFSNFGIATSTFNNGTEQRTSFLNVNEMSDNQLDIETYEFYRINFKI